MKKSIFSLIVMSTIITIVFCINSTYLSVAAAYDCEVQGHVEYENPEIENETSATCTVNGSYDEVYYCQVCNEVVRRTHILTEKLSHKYEKQIKQATNKADGYIKSVCCNCGKIKSETDIYKISSVKLISTKLTYTGNYLKPDFVATDSQGNDISKFACIYSNSRYKVGKYIAKLRFSGNYSGIYKFTYYIVPCKVNGLTKSKLREDSVTLSWNTIPGVSSYEVFQSSDGSSWKRVATVDKTSTKIASLNKSTTYYFKVRANSPGGYGKYSKSIKITTLKSNSEVVYFVVKESNGNSKKFEVENKDYSEKYLSAYKYAKSKATAKNICTIKIPKCSLSSIFLSNNIGYDLSAGVVVKSGMKYTSNSRGKYTGLTNVSIKGGKFELGSGSNPPIRFAHANNVSFTSSLFKYSGSNHMIEFAGCKNMKFDKCSFIGSGSAITKSGYEALQIDILDSKAHFSDAAPYDGTVNKNITVSNCKFSGVSRGVGTRNILAGYYQNKIIIKNNTFNNLTATAIVLSGVINSTITGNTITNCGEGINFYEMTGDGSLKNVAIYDKNGTINKNCNSKIYNNKISVKKTSLISNPTGIWIGGNIVTSKKSSTIKAGYYYVGNIKINNNSISTPAYGIRFFDVIKSTISGNKISATGNAQNAIYLGVSSNSNIISSNKISGKFKSGIVINSSEKNTIKSNTISSPIYYGMNITNNCKANKITSNTISNSGASGITYHNIFRNFKNIFK